MAIGERSVARSRPSRPRTASSRSHNREVPRVDRCDVGGRRHVRSRPRRDRDRSSPVPIGDSRRSRPRVRGALIIHVIVTPPRVSCRPRADDVRESSREADTRTFLPHLPSPSSLRYRSLIDKVVVAAPSAVILSSRAVRLRRGMLAVSFVSADSFPQPSRKRPPSRAAFFVPRT